MAVGAVILHSIQVWLKNSNKQNYYIIHLCTLRPHNLWILACSEQDKVSYHRAALGIFLNLQPDRICWAKGFS